MKNFKFKLEGVLKFRKSKVDRVRYELGKINRNIDEVLRRIKELEKMTGDTINMQGDIFSNTIQARFLQFIPELIVANKNAKEQLNKKLEDLRHDFDEKNQEFLRVKGEYKLIEKIKSKKFKEFKRELNKKIEKNLMDSIQMKFFKEKEKNE